MKLWKNGVLKFNGTFNRTCYSSTYITNSALIMTKITIELAQNCYFL